MSDFSVWMLEASNITVSGGLSLSGFTQGDGSHLVGQTVRLDTGDWLETFITDSGSDSNFDDNDGNQRLDGDQTINGVPYSSGTRVEAEYRITIRNPATGETWDVLSFNVVNSSPAYGTVEGLAFVGDPGSFPPVGVDLVVDFAFEGPGSSGQAAIDASDLTSPICFSRGTLISTPSGARQIETLREGDLVRTADAGPQAIRWIGSQSFAAPDLYRNDKLWPVRIRAGALGVNLPSCDLLLSQQHRVVVRSPIVKRMFQTSEVLVPACKLAGMAGIDIVRPSRRVEYWHMLFDCHHIVFSNGAPAESLYTGKEALKSISAGARDEIGALFAHVLDPGFVPEMARPVPQTGKHIARLLSRHQKNRKDLLTAA